MKKSTFMDEEKMVGEAIKILMKKIGPVETGRFIALPRKKRIESLKRHLLWQSDLDKDQFFDEIFGSNTES
jgi:hypothetical protein